MNTRYVYSVVHRNKEIGDLVFYYNTTNEQEIETEKKKYLITID